MYEQGKQIAELIEAAQSVVVVQADNPDADSLGSALALEQILHEMGKEPYLYAGVDMPGYLRYLQGWDRVSPELPKQFDLSIIVDASTMTLFEKLELSGQKGWLAAKPCIVLDHHEIVENPVPFATITLNDHSRASTGELLYVLGKQLEWQLSKTAQEFIASSILGDTQGLTNQLASAETYRIMAEMIEAGVDRPGLEELRREFNKMAPAIYEYKADLIKRTAFNSGGQIASVVVPQNEINQYSPLYNPAPLIQGDMLQTSGVKMAIVFKHYADGKITGAIRCNAGYPVAAKLAEHLGGGGHAFASGFKVTDGRSLEAVTTDCLAKAAELLAVPAGEDHATI